MTEVPFHLQPRWRSPITTNAFLHFQNGCSHSFCSRAPKQDHRIRHASSTRVCMSGVSLRARALASPVRNPFVSFENLPPNFHNKDDQSSSRLHADELRVPSFLDLPGCQEISAAPLRGLPSPCNAYTKVVSTAIASRRTTAVRQASGTSKISDKCVLTRPPASLQMRAAALSNEKPRWLSTPASTCSTMVAKGVEETATSACTTREGKLLTLRSKRTRNKWEGMVVSLQVGVAVKGAPAPDLMRAFTWSDALLNMASLARSSTTEAGHVLPPSASPSLDHGLLVLSWRGGHIQWPATTVVQTMLCLPRREITCLRIPPMLMPPLGACDARWANN